jgi:SIR2-like domain
MNFDEAIQHAIDGNALLFLGSGFSRGAKPLEGDTFLTGRELARRFYKDCGVDPAPDDDLAHAAQKYRKKKGSDTELITLLEQLYTAADISASHRRMPEIRWSHIYTTNYDNVLEQSYLQAHKKLVPVTAEKDSRDYVSKRNVCVHINGYIDELTPTTLNSSFKLTNGSYLTESFLGSNWAFMFRRAVETVRAVFFVGYSMYDLDIQRIMFQSGVSKEKIFFIERPGLSEDQKLDLMQSDFGEILSIGLDGFWSEYDKVKAQYEPKQLERLLHAFEEFHIPDIVQGFRDDFAFDLLLKGEPRPEHIFDQFVHPRAAPPYFVHRQEHDRVMTALSGGQRDVVVHSDIANGKSIFLTGIACDAIRQGYRVFWLKDSAEEISSEIDAICELPGQVMVIIENYTRRLDDIRHLNLRRVESLVLVISARSSLHEYAVEDLREILGTKSVLQMKLDFINEMDLLKVCTLLDTYKFWGTRDAWPSWRKLKYLKDDCSSEWRSILLEIVRSPEIRARFSPLFASFGNNSELSHVVIAASALKLLGFTAPSEDMISNLLGSTYLFTLDFQRNPMVQQIVTISGQSVIPRSSVLAKFGLTEFAEPKTVVDTLIRIAKRAHEIGAEFNNSFYFNIYKDLVTFSQLQSMLPEKGKRDLLIRFYESVKHLSTAQNHPHFWLQYAIARLAYADKENIDWAKYFLDSAYSQAAKRKNYHTRHLDNVKARYLIEHATVLPSINDALLEMNDAHNILLKEAQTERNAAAYKVARRYLSFYNARKNELTDNGKLLLKRNSSQILSYLEQLPLDERMDLTVANCKESLEIVIRELSVI